MEVRKSIVEVVRALCLIHGKELTEDLVVVWSIPLGHLNDQEIVRGLERILTERTSGFMPVPAEFLEYAITPKGCATIENEAELAWRELERIIRKVGSYKSIYFQNSIIAEWIRLQGGWLAVCLWLERELPWKRKEFISEYVSLRKQNQQFDPLVEGRIDVQNRKFIALGNTSLNIEFVGEFSKSEKEEIIDQIKLTIQGTVKTPGTLSEHATHLLS